MNSEHSRKTQSLALYYQGSHVEKRRDIKVICVVVFQDLRASPKLVASEMFEFVKVACWLDGLTYHYFFVLG